MVRADEPGDRRPAATAAPAVTDAPDPGGTTTGSAKDITAKEAGKPTLVEIAEAVGHNKISINITWTLITGYLVMFMQLGFALVETGFTRAKNAVHTMGMNIMIYGIGMLGFWLCGFAFMWGGSGQTANLGMSANLGNELEPVFIRQGLRHPGLQGIFPVRQRL